MSNIRVEFTVEPFRDGCLSRHVSAVIDSLRSDGLAADIGPFGNCVEGKPELVLRAMAKAAELGFAAGASGIALTIRAVSCDEAEDFLAAIRPVARALGSQILAPGDMPAGAVPVAWKGRIVGGVVRVGPIDLRMGLRKLVEDVERELGGVLPELDRIEKQRAVRMLDDRGAFSMRKSVEDVADAMGVSRVTVYNYLHAARPPRAVGRADGGTSYGGA